MTRRIRGNSWKSKFPVAAIPKSSVDATAVEFPKYRIPIPHNVVTMSPETAELDNPDDTEQLRDYDVGDEVSKLEFLKRRNDAMIPVDDAIKSAAFGEKILDYPEEISGLMELVPGLPIITGSRTPSLMDIPMVRGSKAIIEKLAR